MRKHPPSRGVGPLRMASVPDTATASFPSAPELIVKRRALCGLEAPSCSCAIVGPSGNARPDESPMHKRFVPRAGAVVLCATLLTCWPASQPCSYAQPAPACVDVLTCSLPPLADTRIEVGEGAAWDHGLEEDIEADAQKRAIGYLKFRTGTQVDRGRCRRRWLGRTRRALALCAGLHATDRQAAAMRRGRPRTARDHHEGVSERAGHLLAGDRER
jgi:hypothetical protein